ncbi:MAG: PEP-CTERM sorting domain-containing protein [Chthoniobacterales bacterium]
MDATGRTWTFNEAFGRLELIPEPASTGLIAFGLALAFILRRRTANF